MKSHTVTFLLEKLTQLLRQLAGRFLLWLTEMSHKIVMGMRPFFYLFIYCILNLLQYSVNMKIWKNEFGWLKVCITPRVMRTEKTQGGTGIRYWIFKWRWILPSLPTLPPIERYLKVHLFCTACKDTLFIYMYEIQFRFSFYIGGQKPKRHGLDECRVTLSFYNIKK
jgi:hypothetical protein